MSNSEIKGQTVSVVGAGLTGSMMAAMLAKRGYKVRIFERRSDFRGTGTVESDESSSAFGKVKDASKRSINLALSYRGEKALEQIGILEKVLQHSIPMFERSVHMSNGRTVGQPYGQKDQCIKSVSRADLNIMLLNEAVSYPDVDVFFDHVLRNISKEGELVFEKMEKDSAEKKEIRYPGGFIIGADGAYSAVRTMMSRLCRLNYSQTYISHGYKELCIPPTSSDDFALSPINALHIWPRENCMLIALPNPDKSFTCTLFAPYKSTEDSTGSSLDLLTSVSHSDRADITAKDEEESRYQCFCKLFPDILKLMPNAKNELANNPTGSLAYVSVYPWVVEKENIESGRSIMCLMGDAAHAIVPFYGQGMNSGFEDCLILNELLDETKDNIPAAFKLFQTKRKSAAEALSLLSLNNYREMKNHTTSTTFLIKKKIDMILNRLFPTKWMPLYSMVSFSRIPYDQAQEKSVAQDRKITAGFGAFVMMSVTAFGFGIYKTMHR